MGGGGGGGVLVGGGREQVRVLTLYGKLQMGFKNAQGNDAAFAVPSEPPANPIAGLAGPVDGGAIAQGELNGRGYIDVSYAVPTGQSLDDSSITDLAPEFTIAASSGTIALDATQAPVLVGAATHTYRHWVVSNAATGVTLTPIDKAWSLTDTTTGNTTGNPTTAAAAFGTVDTSHLATPYVDVLLTTTANQSVVASSLGAGDLTFSQTDATGNTT